MQGNEKMYRNYNDCDQKKDIYDNKIIPAFKHMTAIKQITNS